MALDRDKKNEVGGFFIEKRRYIKHVPGNRKRDKRT